MVNVEGNVPKLSELQRATVQFYKNFQLAVQKRNLKKIKSDIDDHFINIEILESQFKYIEMATIENAILSCIAICDDLLKEMFLRESRPSIDIKSMLGPLGPLGDFRKRLSVTSIANYVDDYDIQFLDGLRKLRNNIAHAAIPKPPDENQVRNLLNELPDLVEMFLENKIFSFATKQSLDEKLRAMMVWQIAQLGWKTVVYPQTNKHGVPRELFLEEPHDKYSAIAALACNSVTNIFNGIPEPNK